MNTNYYWRTFFLLSILIFFSSCTHLLHLDRAQSAFNQGATIENSQRFGMSKLENSNAAQINQAVEKDLTSTSPEFYYTIANAEIDKAIAKKGQLKNDNVLGSAYTLKALCEWKLDQYTDAVNTANLALTELESSNVNLPRDKAVMTALRGLVANDIAFDSLGALKVHLDSTITEDTHKDTAVANAIFKEAQRHYQKFIFNNSALLDTTNTLTKEELASQYLNRMKKSNAAPKANIQLALYILEKAQAKAGAGHPSEIYFFMSQLAGVKKLV